MINKNCIVVQQKTEEEKCKREKNKKKNENELMHFLIFLYYIHYQFLHIFFLDLRHFDIIDFRYYNKTQENPTTTWNEKMKPIKKPTKKLYKKEKQMWTCVFLVPED